MRTTVNPGAVVAFTSRAVADAFPGMPLRRVRTMEEALDQQKYRSRS